MPGKLAGKVALITGGSRGIGRATARLFAEEGAELCINFRTATGEATSLVEELKGRGTRAVKIQADISRETEVVEMVRAALAEFGRIDILVNNAGILRTGDFFTLKEEDLDALLATNVKGLIFCTREVARHMMQRKKGTIVNVASNAGIGTAYQGTTAYSMSKAAGMLLTKRFAFEFRGAGIRVNSVAPGYTETEMTVAGKTPEQFKQATADVSSRAMLGRIGRPEEIARAILFLASDDSSFMTSQNMVVDGGRMDYLSHGV